MTVTELTDYRAASRQFFGVAADVKPTSGVPVNSRFLTTDTREESVFDGSEWRTFSAIGRDGLAALGADGGLWTPAQLPDLLTWTEISDLALASDAEIATAGVFSQGTAANRPVNKTNVLNGYPVARFDGANDTMTAGDIGMGLTGLTVGVVVKTTGLQAGNQMVLAKSANASSLNGWRLYLQNIDGAHSWRGGNAGNSAIWHATADIGVFDTNFHILIATFAPGLQELYRDGTLLHGPTGATAHDTNASTLALGANSGGSERLFGDVAGWVICMSQLGAANRSNLKNYWASKYALAVA